jgi:hypothetical protein
MSADVVPFDWQYILSPNGVFLSLVVVVSAVVVVAAADTVVVLGDVLSPVCFTQRPVPVGPSSCR